MVDRMNSTLMEMVRKLVETGKSRWKNEHNKFMYAYNFNKHSVMGYTPYYLLFSRKPQLPVDFILKARQEIEEEEQSYRDYSRMWRENKLSIYYSQPKRGLYQHKTKKTSKQS